LVIFWDRGLLYARWAWTTILFVLPLIAGMTGVCHCAQSLVGMEFHELFAWAGLELWFFWSPPPELVGIIGLSHCGQLEYKILTCNTIYNPLRKIFYV
jgi:hypothetical protein